MISGRVWKFGDNISTDLMLPGSVVYGTEEEQKRLVFAANRPGWVDHVKQGDIIVGGNNFGIGSGRPAARSLINIGIACLLVESVNGLFLRNAVNFGLPMMECAGVISTFSEGDIAEVDFDTFTVRNATKGGDRLNGAPIPSKLLDLMLGGGLFPQMEAQGFISKPRKKG